VAAFIVFAAGWTETATALFETLRAEILVVFKPWYVVLVASMFVFVLWLGLGRYKNIRLGAQDEAPEFGLFSWFAMLFAAGMGIGLIFWGVAEPVRHFHANPFVAEGGTPEAATVALRLAFFHWGLHAWAVYAFVGLILSYYAYRLDLPLSIRSAFWPLLGWRIYGPIGHAIDVFAAFGTVFGVATSLGLGVRQMNGGLAAIAGVPFGIGPQLAIIAVVTAAAVLSVASGVRRGVRLLSDLNLWLTVGLLAFVLIFGPTLYLVGLFLTALGDYLQTLPSLSFWTEVDRGSDWQEEWTLFYWAWWVAWAPFVGLFIARVSRGRKIRDFVMGILLVPTALTGLWLAVFGGTAVYLELYGDARIGEIVDRDAARALYALFEALALPGVVEVTLAAAATLLIAVYFVTSCDSGTLAVTTMLACGHGDPPLRHRVLWGVGEGAIAALLLTAGGLTALQAAVITAGLPFSVVMAGMAYAFLRALREEEAAPRPVAAEGRGRASEPWTGRDGEAGDSAPAGAQRGAERP
jgi:choline/glycine/proline betaine transport protein